MVDALIASTVLLWIAVLVLALVVLALLRQVGVLHERIAPAGALMGRETPRVGEAAPVLSGVGWNGETLRVGGEDAAGSATLLLFVSPRCPVCKSLLPVARSLRDATPGLRLLLASDGEREEHVAFVAAERVDRDGYLLSTELGLRFQVARLPYAVLIDGLGVVRARGLVNTREHLESLLEAQRLGVASIQDWLQRESAPEPAPRAEDPMGASLR